MRTSTLILPLVLAATTPALRIFQGNDDGWDELLTRLFNEALTKEGHEVVLSAPAQDQSGKGRTDEDPQARTTPCQYNSCDPKGQRFGHDTENPRLNWVNGYPVTAARIGFEKIMPQVWKEHGGKPDLAVSGINVGTNAFWTMGPSGTCMVARYATREHRVPAIAFSAASSIRLSGSNTAAADTPAPLPRFASLATQFTQALIQQGAPYLPQDVFLNVNFPLSDDKLCTSLDDFKWIFTRLGKAEADTPKDMHTCGSDRLEDESLFSYRTDLLKRLRQRNRCFITVSAVSVRAEEYFPSAPGSQAAANVPAKTQELIYKRLEAAGIRWSCLEQDDKPDKPKTQSLPQSPPKSPPRSPPRTLPEEQKSSRR